MLAILVLGGTTVAIAGPAEDARMRELQAQIDALEQQAAAKRAIIATTHQQAESLKKAIALIQSQISAVQAELSATEAKIDKTEVEISTVEQEIEQKRAAMSRKRESIGRMVFFLDRIDQDNLIANLFKYRSLSDFVAQLHDIASVEREVMVVITDLKAAKADLEADKTELEEKHEVLEDLSEQAAQRAQQLAGVKGEKDRVLRTTKGQEAEYQRQLAIIEDQKSAFFKELREIELKVVSGGLYIVHVTATSVPPAGTKLFQKPEEKGFITQGYGCTKYARCGNSRGPYGGAPHNGVDISSGIGTPIMAIGAGKIVADGSNDGWGNWIAVQHTNNMVSVYAHMSTFAGLRAGADVTAGQVIGYEGKTGKVTGSHLHLTLYKEFFTYLNAKNQLNFNYFEGTLNPLNYM